MQVAFYFAGEITQVLDAIPWVRCASGNVLVVICHPQHLELFGAVGNIAKTLPEAQRTQGIASKT